MSVEGYTRLKAWASANNTLNRDSIMLDRIRMIAGRLIPKTRVFRDNEPGRNREVNIIDSNVLNTFVMPGGKMMVYSRSINHLRLADNEIAIVLGHEIAYTLRVHLREQTRCNVLQQKQ